MFVEFCLDRKSRARGSKRSVPRYGTRRLSTWILPIMKCATSARKPECSLEEP